MRRRRARVRANSQANNNNNNAVILGVCFCKKLGRFPTLAARLRANKERKTSHNEDEFAGRVRNCILLRFKLEFN